MNCFLLLFVFPRCCFVSFSFCWLWVSFGGAFKMSPRMHASTSNEIVFHFAYFFFPVVVALLLLRYFKTHVCRMTKSHRNTNDNHSDNDARSINKNKNKKWEIKIGERTRHTHFFFFVFRFVHYYDYGIICILFRRVNGCAFNLLFYGSISVDLNTYGFACLPLQLIQLMQLMCSTWNDEQNAFSACVNFI